MEIRSPNGFLITYEAHPGPAGLTGSGPPGSAGILPAQTQGGRSARAGSPRSQEVVLLKIPRSREAPGPWMSLVRNQEWL